jgi:pyruvate/2-oxoglutarate dehydrogenase complex dihydrolipoamide dehydrogenase (E3) component
MLSMLRGLTHLFFSLQDKTVMGLTGGIEGLFKKAKVDYYQGTGEIKAAGEVAMHALDGSGTVTLKGKSIVIATGSEPAKLNGVKVRGKGGLGWVRSRARASWLRRGRSQPS